MENINLVSWAMKTADRIKKSVLIVPSRVIIQRNDGLTPLPAVSKQLQPFHFCYVVKALFHKSWQAHADALGKLQKESFFHFAVCNCVADFRQFVDFNHDGV